jgi:TolB protein
MVAALLALLAMVIGAAPAGRQVPNEHRPTGRIVFYDDAPGGDGTPADWEVYVLDVGTGKVDRLTHNRAGDFDVSWSHSGSELAFARYVGRGVSPRLPNADIFVMSFGGAVDRVTATRRVEAEPAISPDGTKIAFTRWGYDAYPPRAEIWIMDRDGSHATRLTDSRPWGAGNAAWSPDGSHIAFVSDRGGDADLYVMRADGSDVRLVAGSNANEGDPEWSPDGDRIAYDRIQGNGTKGGIFVLDVATGTRTRLTATADMASNPSWSPDGHMIAFLGNRSNDPPWDLYVMDARPYAPWEPLLESAGAPSWAP